MNDSRWRLPTPGASLLLGLIVGCGSSGGSSSSTSEARANAAPATEALAPVSRTTAAPREEVAHVVETDTLGAVHGPSAPFLCSREPVAFDLSALDPEGDVPVGFAAAWLYAKQRTHLPGFVVAYSGTTTGPSLGVRVGAVRKVTTGIYTFMKTLPGTETAHVGLNAVDPYLVRSENLGTFVTAFGTTEHREGFIVSGITVEGRLDETCRAMKHVRVTMTLPKENRGQHFGDQVLGEELLGRMTVDTDHDGNPDAWTIRLTGEYLDNMMFSL